MILFCCFKKISSLNIKNHQQVMKNAALMEEHLNSLRRKWPKDVSGKGAEICVAMMSIFSEVSTADGTEGFDMKLQVYNQLVILII